MKAASRTTVDGICPLLILLYELQAILTKFITKFILHRWTFGLHLTPTKITIRIYF